MNLLDKYFSPNFAPEDGGAPTPDGAAAPAPTSQTPAPSPSTPSPSPTPAGGTPPAQATPSPISDGVGGGDGDSWSSIFDDSPTAPGVTAEIVQPPPVAQPPVSPQPPPAATPQTPPVAPLAQPAGQPGAATPQTPPQAAFDRFDPGTLAHHLASNEAAALEYVAQNVFRLTPQEVEALETNVVDTIPKLLAKVFVKSQQNVLSQLATMVPTMIQRQTVAMRLNDQNADKFYERWPMIKKSEHSDLVNKYGSVYRQMHPQATLEQMIEDLGPMVMMAGRIPPQLAAQAPSGQPVNPAAQRAAANGRSPPPSPFVPAGSAAPTAASTAPEVSPWEAMFRQE